MAKTLTITVPDDAYASLQSAAVIASQSPEELAAQVVMERFQEPSRRRPTNENEARERALASMRARGHLVEPAPQVGLPGAVTLPPEGSPERLALEEEVAADFGDALARSGLSVLDLVERR